MQKLKVLNLTLYDYNSHGPIQMLFGTDIAGLWYIGKRHVMRNGSK